jgi:chromosome segregation ATPase
VPFDLETLRAERDRVKETLRDLELESRKLDAEVKSLRQREMQAKREIEAYGALIEVFETRAGITPPKSPS